jgi:WhiB family redox-sensing transcriptional regulator
MRARPGQPPIPTWLPDFIPDGVAPACREDGVDPEVFFPTRREGPGWVAPEVIVEEAKAICGRCPVKEPCADWAADTGQEFGYWGGLGPEELKRLRLKRRLVS